MFTLYRYQCGYWLRKYAEIARLYVVETVAVLRFSLKNNIVNSFGPNMCREEQLVAVDLIFVLFDNFLAEYCINHVS